MKGYLEFFGFKDDPFKITPDPKYFYLTETHEEAIGTLRYLVESEEGFAVIIGEPGTGKTITVRKFIDEIEGQIRYAYILFPNLKPEELFNTILEDFGIRNVGQSKNALFIALRDYLIEINKTTKVLLIIDEAQDLPVETLEELRLLSNLETEDKKLLQIILLGQPELEEKIRSRHLEQLSQRITLWVKLRHLKEEEVRDYINFRIMTAGGNVKVEKKVYELVYRYSDGIPRLINTIMERALMTAYLDESEEIKREHVLRAVEVLNLKPRESKKSLKLPINLPLASLYLSSLALFLSGVFLYLGGYKREGFKEVKVKPLRGVRYARVRSYMLNVRDRPSREGSIIYVLNRGERVILTNQREGLWQKIYIDRGDFRISGWVNLKYLDFER